MKIAMVQFDVDFLKVQENKAKAERYVAEAVAENADMILFPEFFTTGFALNMGIYQAVAENKDIREWMAGLSRKNAKRQSCFLRKCSSRQQNWMAYQTSRQGRRGGGHLPPMRECLPVTASHRTGG